MMCGTNGSQVWDAAFISQALSETRLGEEAENKESTRKVLEWLDEAQIRENPKFYKEAYRHAVRHRLQSFRVFSHLTFLDLDRRKVPGHSPRKSRATQSVTVLRKL